jgi:hypothetical protein
LALEREPFRIALHKREPASVRLGEGARVKKLLPGQIDTDRAGTLSA